MSVPVANVVLSFSQEPLDQLFTANNPTNRAAILSDLAQGNDAMVFNNQGNSNFISMTHSFANINEPWKVEIKLIDPNNEFERRWFTANVMQLTAATLNTPGPPPTQDETTPRILDEETRLSLIEAYQRAFKNRYVFLAYGVGTNINSWAGPIKMQLSNATVSAKGAKEVTLTFVPMLATVNVASRKGAYDEIAMLALEGLREQTEGISEPLNFLKANEKPIYTPRGYIRKIQNKTKYRDEGLEILSDIEDSGLAEVSEFIRQIDIHSIVVDVIRQYIQNATSSTNVIVLLPDINWICRDALDVLLKETRLISPIRRALSSFGIVPTPGATSFVNEEEAFLGVYYETLRVILGRFGIDLTATNLSIFNTAFPTPSLRTWQERFGAAGPALGVPDPPEGHPWALPGQDSPAALTNYRKQIRYFYAGRKFEAAKVSVRESGSIIDHGKILKDMVDLIKDKSTSEYRIMGPVVVYEGDTEILAKWKEYSDKSPLFFGDDGMVEATPGSPDPVIIFGDASLIKRFLYAREDLDKTKEDIAGFRMRVRSGVRLKEYFDRAPTPASEFPDFSPLGSLGMGEPYSVDPLITNLPGNISLVRNHAPLHPADSIVLMDEEYSQEMKNILYKTGNVVGAFGSTSNLPRDFSNDLRDQLEAEESTATPDYLTEHGIPVFRYNYENPNITNLDFKFGHNYFIELQKGFRKNILNLASMTVGGAMQNKYSKLPLQSLGAGIAYLRQRELCELDPFIVENARADLESLYEDLALTLPEDAVALAERVITLYSFLKDNVSYKSNILIDQFLPGRPDSILADMARQMYTRSLQLNIKTLPTFHLSNTAVGLQFPALVLAQDAPIIGSDLSTRSPLNRIWSGLWSIYGWTHTISTRNVESSFRLVKTSMDTGQETEETLEQELLEIEDEMEDINEGADE